MTERYGDSTRTVKAADCDAVAGRRVPVPVPASAFHLSAEEGTEAHVCGRYSIRSGPIWSRRWRGEEATTALTFGSGHGRGHRHAARLVKPAPS